MARRVDYILRETLVGLRRNGSIAFAAVTTAFISLFLLGGTLLINRQANLLIDALTANVEVSVFLTDPVSSDNVAHLTGTIEELSVVESVDYESKQEAFRRAQRIFAGQQSVLESLTAEALPASLRVKMADPDEFAQVAAKLGCAPDAEGTIKCSEPGIEQVQDNRTTLRALFSVINFFRVIVGTLAVIALVSSALLIANTVRVGLFARRKEIGIMKLVGATNWRIRIPFLVEGVVQALIGAGVAILGLFIVKVAYVDPERDVLEFIPFIVNRDIVVLAPLLVGVSLLLAVAASFIAMRRFLDV